MLRGPGPPGPRGAGPARYGSRALVFVGAASALAGMTITLQNSLNAEACFFS